MTGIDRLRRAPGTVAERLALHVAGLRHATRRRRSSEEVLQSAFGADDTAACVAAFRRRSRPSFFFCPERLGEIVEHLDAAVQEWQATTLSAADRLCAHRVRLLGADDLDLGGFSSADGSKSKSPPGLPWHCDVLNDYRWDPGTFYRRVEVPVGRADIKVPWELSRAQHLPTLGMAYCAGGNDRYAAEVVAQIDDWIDANPVGCGVNWACAMDVAIRAVNWLWAYHLIAGAAAVTDAFLVRYLASLVEHGRHLAQNIERFPGGVTTNHTLADYVGLLYLGLLLPEAREASSWAAAGRAGVVECMRTQVLPDGVDFESSVAYHRLVLEMFAGAYLLAERNGRPLPETYRASLERMFEFVYHYVRPDGLAPLIGDSDDGRLQILSRYFDWEARDHRYLLGLGAAIFGRDDFAALARDAPGAVEEATWLTGTIPSLDRGRGRLADPRRSRAFTPSGRYVMRHGSHFALVCADEVGTAGLGNHKHNDILGYELAVAGAPIVVDAGSFLYTSDPGWRDRFRSTRSHSTLVVDGSEQNEVVGPFGLRPDARVQVHLWRPGADADVLDASHTGYHRLPQPVTHRRRFCMLADPFAWLVLDTLEGRGRHRVESMLHFEPGGEVAPAATTDEDAVRELLQAAQATLRDAGVDETLEAFLGDGHRYRTERVAVDIVPVNWKGFEISEGWVSPRYGRRTPAPVLSIERELAAGSSVGYLVFLPPDRR